MLHVRITGRPFAESTDQLRTREVEPLHRRIEVALEGGAAVGANDAVGRNA